MNDYFSAISPFIEEKCLFDVTMGTQHPMIAAIGDYLLFTRNPNNSEDTTYDLDSSINYQALSLAPNSSNCIMGGTNNAVLQYNFNDKSSVKLLDTLGAVTSLRYSHNGKYFAVGSEEAKTIIYEPLTGRKQKCRPGHNIGICDIFISRDDKFIGSIGQDKHLLIYKIQGLSQPQEVARYIITTLEDCSEMSGSFHFSHSIVFAPGLNVLQKIEYIEGRWEYSKIPAIHHNTTIFAVQTFKENALATSSKEEVSIWNIREGQKLFQIEQFHLTKMIAEGGKFYGVRNDGKIYHYERETKQEEPMEIEHDSNLIEFQMKQEGQKQEEDEEEQEKQQKFYHHKKSKADKLILCLPQPTITTGTTSYNNNRFLFVNQYGYVIERQQGEEETFIELELQNQKKKIKMPLFRNKKVELFDINNAIVLYATSNEFGIKVLNHNNLQFWECIWHDIESIALGTNWLSIANDQAIKIVDFCGHQIKTIPFDRQIIAIRAHENILTVIYHEAIPIEGAQQLAMQLFVVDATNSQSVALSQVHLPMKPGSLLRWVGFSPEGMLFSQDSYGNIRAFNLQNSQWTTVGVTEEQNMRKVWVIGVRNYQLIYWKTSDQDPEPTVAPRFNIKKSKLFVPTIGNHPENTQQTYEQLLWQRYILDHQKARAKLWGRLKLSRISQSQYFALSQSIATDRQLALKHGELDEKYYPLVEEYLAANEGMKAMMLVKSCIRSMAVGRKLIDLFDYSHKRNMAIQLQDYYDQKQKELEYEQMQIFQFMKMREQAERIIKPRSQDPMRRGAPRKITQSIPFINQNFSQQSFQSNDKMNMSQISNNSQMPSQVSRESAIEEVDNPFLKKKSNHQSLQAKKKQITDQVERFGIKRKAEERNLSRKTTK